MKIELDSEQLTIHNGKIYQRVTNHLYDGYRPLQLDIPSGGLEFGWHGPRMNMDEWRKAVRFMAWVNEHDHSEAQLRAFVVGDEIKVWAFPQEKNSGMTTKEIPGDEFDRQLQPFLNGDQIMTIHSHCNTSAFQSGTDKHDEDTVDGLHITIGKLKEQQLDIHHRAYFCGVSYEFKGLTAWFDDGLNDAVADEIKKTFHVTDNQILLLAMLASCPKEEFDAPDAFPDQWKANLIVRKAVTSIPVGGYAGSYSQGYFTGGNGGNVSVNPWCGYSYFPKVKRTGGRMSVAEYRTVLCILSEVFTRWATRSPKDVLEAMKDKTENWGVWGIEQHRVVDECKTFGYSKADIISTLNWYINKLRDGSYVKEREAAKTAAVDADIKELNATRELQEQQAWAEFYGQS